MATEQAHAAPAAVAPAAAAELPTIVERRIGWLLAGTGLALFFLMMLLGITMRASQADLVDIPAKWYYRILTLHGAGMLVGALLAMMGALWFVLRPVITLSAKRLLWAYGCIVGGALLVLVAAIIGGFATGWTFLSPLPFHPLGQWAPWATATFFVGMLLVGTGFFLYCIDLVLATTTRYGGLSSALGIPFLLVALGFGWATRALTFLRSHIRIVNIIGGVLLIVLGLLMVTGVWTDIMSKLGAVVSSVELPL